MYRRGNPLFHGGNLDTTLRERSAQVTLKVNSIDKNQFLMTQ